MFRSEGESGPTDRQTARHPFGAILLFVFHVCGFLPPEPPSRHMQVPQQRLLRFGALGKSFDHRHFVPVSRFQPTIFVALLHEACKNEKDDKSPENERGKEWTELDGTVWKEV